MQNIWKFTTVVLLIACLAMGFYLFEGKTSVEESGTISTDEINVDDVDYKKKQNPNFSVANNDYFFQNPTTIKFLSDEYNFDTIPVNKIIERDIRYINTGKNPYFIKDLK
jgi:hypothetical protein